MITVHVFGNGKKERGCGKEKSVFVKAERKESFGSEALGNRTSASKLLGKYSLLCHTAKIS